jgi:hypothetical protein
MGQAASYAPTFIRGILIVSEIKIQVARGFELNPGNHTQLRYVRSGGLHDIYFMHRGRDGWVVGGTMNPSPSTDRQYIEFNNFLPYKAGTYATNYIGIS